MPTLAIVRFTEEQSEDVLDEFSWRVVKGIREYLKRVVKGTGSLGSSIRARVYGKEIVIESDRPYAKGLDRGTSGRTMWSLINKVIPLKLKDGTVIFRRVTMESIRRGKWNATPHPGLNYVERGVDVARSEMSLRAQLAYVVQTASFA
jgi:hypothetical protein